ncbi:uncharacterized protein LOC132744579 [Ruditapes philippinarum]|uniref:uncharacterized protein LOC132744579 n=1 Tax=Ruditapes philippinarum TaxID=129788 RepID=UPI00295B8415|nr:uncharacterized protein LOC132744579 [Ruditapes philippinarum]
MSTLKAASLILFYCQFLRPVIGQSTLSDSNHTVTEDYSGSEDHGATTKEYSYTKEIIAAAVIGTICFVMLAMLLLYFKPGRKDSACYTKDDPADKDDQDVELKEIFITDQVKGGSDTV